MKAVLLPAIAALFAASALPASAETKTYNLSGFDEISVSAGVNVVLKQGPYSVSASEPDGKFDRLILETRGKRLVVSRESGLWTGFFGRGPRYTVTVTAPSINEINVSSGADFDGENVKFAALEVNVSSGADLELSGSCTNLEVNISSGADFDGEELHCETASIDASSGADADVFASKSARGDASSGADITFHGKPATFDKDTSSGGSVKSL